MRRFVPLLAFSLTLVVCPPARANEDSVPLRFGASRNLVLTASTQLMLGSFGSGSRTLGQDPRLSWGHTSEGGGSTLLALALGADYFVVRDLSVGAAIAYGRELDRWGAGGSARVGYNVPLGSRFSVWPRVDISYEHWARGEASVASLNKLHVGGYAPLLFHPATHFFLGIGPMIDQGIYARSSDAAATNAEKPVTIVGLQSVLGGWFEP
jgi:hypothetical protein